MYTIFSTDLDIIVRNSTHEFKDIQKIFTRARERRDRETEFINSFEFVIKCKKDEGSYLIAVCETHFSRKRKIF